MVRTQFHQWLPDLWITAYQTVVIAGPTGCGKTFLACALGQAACRQNPACATSVGVAWWNARIRRWGKP
ncbi:MAG: ATP-binding protein [Firmicutes bacterium]|nr:ATP-binding protein [Bacillota bacterium]